MAAGLGAATPCLLIPQRTFFVHSGDFLSEAPALPSWELERGPPGPACQVGTVVKSVLSVGT